VVFKDRFASLQAEIVSLKQELKDLMRGLQTQVDLNLSTLSNVSSNVVHIGIDVQSLILKHKEDIVDDLREEEEEEEIVGTTVDGLHKMDEYGSIIVDFVHPSYTVRNPSFSLQSMF
jgi:recombinational DNA repair ATPase RecF